MRQGPHNGSDTCQEDEAHDRTSIGLPGMQEDLLRAIATQTSTPLVVVLMSGSALSVPFAAQSPRVSSVLWTSYGGEEMGSALADVLLGVVSPSGR